MLCLLVKGATALVVHMLIARCVFSVILRCTSSQKRKCCYGELDNALQKLLLSVAVSLTCVKMSAGLM